MTDDGEFELVFIVYGGEVGLVEHAHSVDAHSLASKLAHVRGLKGLPDVGVETFYAH